MLKIYIGEQVPNLPLTAVVRTVAGATPFEGGGLNNHGYTYLASPLFESVNSVEEAEYIILPHDYGFVVSMRRYLKYFSDLSIKSGKPILVFAPGDFPTDVKISNAVVFKYSAYRRFIKPNEIIMPPPVEDLLVGRTFVPRKKEIRPTVGFCGWAMSSGVRQAVIFAIKYFMADLVSLFSRDRLFSTKKKGIWWRKRALDVLRSNDRVGTDFIVRSTYSGALKTVSLEPVQARSEYVENILSNDFTLCVKGDGNYSYRFFEVLSLGRFPLLLDTDCVLPLEGEIDYDEFSVRVDSSKISELPYEAFNFWNSISPEEVTRREFKAREVFERFLRLDCFFRFVLRKDFLKRYHH
ncbi:MAG: exostosin family protein [bacterium]|nr:exostosin family protein [bacterium]